MDTPDPRVGAVVAGRYKILERTSAGSMGVVYRGERLQLKRPVAIKFLNEGYAASADGMRRFEVEAKAMSRLEHPNCVPVTDYGVVDGQPYLVMDFVKGITLAQLLANEWRVTPARAVGIMRQVANGLAHAHAQRIIHRDVKPANVLVSLAEGHGDHVRLVDFGLAKLRDEGSFTTGLAIGTPSYMSPEQTIGEKADERSDIYACGVILYELITGAKPFQAESPFETMRMHREARALPLTDAAAGVEVSPRLAAVVDKAMAKAPAERYQSMSEFRTALEQVDEAGGGKGRGGRRLLVGGLLAAVVVAGGAVGVWQLRGGETSATDAATVALITDAGASPPAIDAPPPIDAAEAPVVEDDPPPPSSADKIAKLRALATEHGNLRGAISGLEALRKAQPNDAAVHHALAATYAEDQRWDKVVPSYATALRLDPALRDDPRLVGDVVEALGSKAYRAAEKLIERELAVTAGDRLDEASRSTNRTLRTRARKLRSRLR